MAFVQLHYSIFDNSFGFPCAHTADKTVVEMLTRQGPVNLRIAVMVVELREIDDTVTTAVARFPIDFEHDAICRECHPQVPRPTKASSKTVETISSARCLGAAMPDAVNPPSTVPDALRNPSRPACRRPPTQGRFPLRHIADRALRAACFRTAAGAP